MLNIFSQRLLVLADEIVYKEWEDRMERAATTASSLEAEQDSEAQSRFEAASKQSNDPLLSSVNTLGSGEDNMKLMELMEHYTTLSELPKITTVGEVVTTANVEVTTVNALTTTIDELTLAQTLIEIKVAKPKAVTSFATTTTTTRPKARGVVLQEPSEFKTTSLSLQESQLPQAKNKGKGIMVEPEVPLKKKDQVALDEEMARNLEAQLQAELIEEEKISSQKEEEANIALLES
ncbi:hypothetical protein Tco_0743496 [Tanacetum coccineum]